MASNKGIHIEWLSAPDIKRRLIKLKNSLDLDWLNIKQIYCFRSVNSSSRAYARIWGLTRIWQLALNSKPSYVIEVLSERFDHLTETEKDKVLLHEITHIPRNFSGSLLPHVRKKGKRNFEDRVRKLIFAYSRR